MYVKDGIYGLMIGDILGVPVEFMSKEEIAENPVTGLRGYGTHMKPLGTYSDDTSMVLATLTSITKNKGVHLKGIMEEFLRWVYLGLYTQDGQAWGLGNTTYDSIIRYLQGYDVDECGGIGERDNGNGSLMRILPLAYLSDDEYSLELVEQVSALTHAHDRSKIGCALYVEIARSLIKNHDEGWSFCDHVDIASEKIREHYKGNSELSYYERVMNKDYEGGVRSSGYVVNTLECACYSIRVTESFEEALLYAVNLGGDTDTVGAVCGGLAGLYYGLDSIPTEWLESVRDLEFVESICNDFEDSLSL
jgi:ADP-ribosylglycohydrolase